MSCKEKFWLTNITGLFKSLQVIPMNDMSLGEQMNALTRLMIILFVIMFLFNFPYSLLFLVISLVLIIISYYIRKMQSKHENYCDPGYCHNPSVKRPLQGVTPVDTSWYTEAPLPGEQPIDQKNPTQSFIIRNEPPQYFCNDERPVRYNDPTWISPNAKLGMGQNPKTLIKPLVVPPSHDLTYWRANNLITHSNVNKATQKDAYLSGYAVSTCCGNLECQEVVPIPGPEYKVYVGGMGGYNEVDNGENVENFRSPKPADIIPPMMPNMPVKNTIETFRSPKPADIIPPMMPNMPVKNTIETFRSPKPADIIPPMMPNMPVENYTIPETWPYPIHSAPVVPNQSGWVNTTCGYNPKQVFEADLPSNLAVGNCPQDPVMKQYNKNLFTQIIQPGVYTRSQVNEPINSNIGISFQQQFEPLTCKRDETGLHYLEHDPRIIEPAIVEENYPPTPANEANVYDPRFSGYGTSYRAYTDPLLGQTRFAYDDINAIRMPNYLVRSKIDNQPYADSYGPMKPGQTEGNEMTSMIRGLAQDSWMRDSIQFRNELTERLMRKTNAEQWQRRSAPKYTM